MSKNDMSEYKAIIQTIEHLREYFVKHYVDPNDPTEKNLNTHAYAIEAFELIVECVEDNGISYKQFEHLTNQTDFDSFEKIFDELELIDLVVDRFESR